MTSKLWPAGIFVLLGLNVAIVATTIVLATTSDSTVVESRPYEKSLDWNQEQRRRSASRELNWTCTVGLTMSDSHQAATARLSIADHSGTPLPELTIRGEIFHHARSNERSTLCFEAVPHEPGAYTATLAAPKSMRPGLWRLCLVATRQTSPGKQPDTFLRECDALLNVPSPTGRPTASSPQP